MTAIIEFNPESISVINHAVQSLAGVCDGAITRDGIGFNGTDTKFGHRAANIPVNEWSTDMLITCAMVLRKYARQLSMYGIEIIPAIDSIMESAGEIDERNVSETGHKEAWQKEYDRKHAPYVEIRDGRIYVLNSYSIKDELRRNGFSYANRAWYADLNSVSAHTVLGIPAIVIPSDIHDYLMTFPVPTADDLATSEEITENFTVKDDGSGMLVMRTDYGQVPLVVIRAIPGRKWDGLNRVNYVSALPGIIKLAEDYGLTISDEALALIETNRAAYEQEKINSAKMAEASRAVNTDRTDLALFDYMRPFQRAGVAYALDTERQFAGRTLIGDEMGLGKTCQALSAMETANAFPLLIVAPSSLIYNWEKEVKKLLPNRSAYVYAFKKVGNGFDIDEDIIIMPYGVVSSYLDSLPTLKGFICDESHYVKNPKAQRTNAILTITGKGRTDDGTAIPSLMAEDSHIVFLTGTPILNRPVELVEQLRALGVLSDHPSASIEGTAAWFKYSFCGASQGFRGRVSFTGSSNEEELNAWLRAKCMVRRSKKDVLKELPAKVRSAQFIELTRSARKLYEKLAREGAEKAAESRAEALVYLNALRKAVGDAKIEMALEWAIDFLETGKQLVIFGNHVNVQHEIITGLRAAGYDVTHILGGQDKQTIEDHKERFQNGTSQVIVLSLTAAREGHTLTAASDVLFIEQGWNPGTHNQAEDRCHRIGQTDSVTAWYLVGMDTIDEWLYELIEAKRIICDAVNDGAVMDSDNDDSVMMEVLDRALGKYGVKRQF